MFHLRVPYRLNTFRLDHYIFSFTTSIDFRRVSLLVSLLSLAPIPKPNPKNPFDLLERRSSTRTCTRTRTVRTSSIVKTEFAVNKSL